MPTKSIFRAAVVLFFFMIQVISVSATENADEGHAAPNLGGRFESITTDDGLSSSVVTSIIQDRHGFIWIGTDEGLNRYDGYRFKVYNNNPDNADSIANNSIAALYEDADGIIWIVYQRGGFSRFDPETDTFRHYVKKSGRGGSLLSHELFSIVEDQSDNLWIGASGGLIKFNKRTEAITEYEGSQGSGNIPPGVIVKVLADRSGYIWLTTNIGLGRFDPEAETFKAFSPRLMSLESKGRFIVRDMTMDIKETIWLTSNLKGLLRFDTARKSFTRYGCFSDTTKLFLDSDGDLWIGTSSQGIYKFNPDTDEAIHYRNVPSVPKSLSINNAISFYEDREGLIWIGSRGTGININNPASRQFALFRAEPDNLNSLNNNEVSAILKGSSATLWVGTSGGGLNAYDSGTHRWRAYTQDSAPGYRLSDDFVFALCEDKENNLFIGTRKGLDRLDIGTGKVNQFASRQSKKRKLPQGHVSSCMVDSAGDLWVGTDIGGLLRLAKGADKFEVYGAGNEQANTLIHNRILTIYEDSSNLVWVGTPLGLSLYDRENDTFLNYLNEDVTVAVNSIKGTPDGRLWLGTSCGLSVLDPPTGIYMRITRGRALPARNVTNIQFDAHGNLWLTAGKGLTKYNPDTGVHATYDVTDGLQGNEFLSSYYDKDNNMMYYGGINGFNSFDPDMIESNQYRPPVVLTDFRILNKEVPVGPDSVLKKQIWAMTGQDDRIVLNHRQSIISFEFAALSYAAPQRNRYRYQLEGLDRDMIETDSSRRFVSYASLPPGDYVFRVKGSNNNELMSNSEVALNITVLPAWWMTLWFKVLVVFAVAAVLFLIYEGRISTVRKHNIELEALVKERTKQIEKHVLELERRNAIITKQTKQLEEMARTDPLTKLPNRRDFLEKADVENARADRSGKPISIIMSDIDHFKLVNDTYGHDCGDYVLKTIAETIRNTMRKQDVYARWGGEEFIALLPETNLEGARTLAEKLRKKIQETTIVYEDYTFNITMTFGVGVRAPGANIEDAIKRADEALYVGKEGGRNRVVSEDMMEK